MVATRSRSLSVDLLAAPTRPTIRVPTADVYENMRQARIRENLARMQKLGLHSLSLQIKEPIHRRSAPAPSKPPVLSPSRRSSRLQNAPLVSYTELAVSDGRGKRGIEAREGKKEEEVYTDEHEKLLGTCERSWDLFFDGCGADGKRVYDQVNGKTCHQCRQKTLGHRTHCCKCNIVRRQFCGDCLYIRYGENVLEANKNPNWICPVCRGICNCSICRTKQGLAPTGAIYKKALNLGFKSVAHYLIQTHRRHPGDSGDQNIARSSSKNSLCFSDSEEVSENGAKSVPSAENNSERNEEGGSQSKDEHIVSDVLTAPKHKAECENGKQHAAIPVPISDSIGARVRNRRNKA